MQINHVVGNTIITDIRGQLEMPRALAKPMAVKSNVFYQGRWVLTLDNGQEVVDPKLEKARSVAARIISGQFFPMVGRVIDVRV